jgi:hypothetical protein
MLGLRFKVVILVPMITIGSAATLAIGIADGNSLWSVLLAMVVVITALQMGYLSGTIIRFSIAGARVHKETSLIVTQRAAR